MIACIPKSHHLARKKSFPIKLFEEENFIAPYPDYDTDYRRSFEKSGVHPNIRFTTMDIYAAYCMVEAGLGCTLLNKIEVEAWNGEVELIRTEAEIEHEIGIMHPNTGNMSVAARAFLKEIGGI